MSEEKKDVLRERLFYTQKQGYDLIDLEERLKLEAYCEDYKAFLDASRTEREAVCEGIRQAEEAGFVPYVRGMELKAGDKVYQSVRGKALMLAVIGKKSLAEGANIAAAHVDSPRLDLKQLPLYEDGELAYLKTHYYGGIKKYQWLTIPLELHGVVTRKDPKFVITDLLPHLGKDQMSKSAADVVSGENLSLLVGSIPYADEGKDRVKLAILSMLCDRYGITEEDFLSAELEAVPSLDTCDVGLDRSLIGGYGHDDRVCAYAELKAIYETEAPDRNGAKVNYGMGICKFTGSRGKSGSNDASAEVVGTLRKIFADNAVVWQMAELGKVDQGGGGTVALYMGNRNIDTIDAGVPVLSMHSPWETVAKFDCYMTYKGMWAFYKDR